MIWLLKRIDEDQGYDEDRGVVVSAPSVRAARRRVAARKGNEPAEIWLSPKTSSCRRLTDDEPEGIILRGYLAG